MSPTFKSFDSLSALLNKSEVSVEQSESSKNDIKPREGAPQIEVKGAGRLFSVDKDGNIITKMHGDAHWNRDHCMMELNRLVSVFLRYSPNILERYPLLQTLRNDNIPVPEEVIKEASSQLYPDAVFAAGGGGGTLRFDGSSLLTPEQQAAERSAIWDRERDRESRGHTFHTTHLQKQDYALGGGWSADGMRHDEGGTGTAYIYCTHDFEYGEGEWMEMGQQRWRMSDIDHTGKEVTDKSECAGLRGISWPMVLEGVCILAVGSYAETKNILLPHEAKVLLECWHRDGEPLHVIWRGYRFDIWEGNYLGKLDQGVAVHTFPYADYEKFSTTTTSKPQKSKEHKEALTPVEYTFEVVNGLLVAIAVLPDQTRVFVPIRGKAEGGGVDLDLGSRGLEAGHRSGWKTINFTTEEQGRFYDMLEEGKFFNVAHSEDFEAERELAEAQRKKEEERLYG